MKASEADDLLASGGDDEEQRLPVRVRHWPTSALAPPSVRPSVPVCR